jgi:GNAT superfamily N-acetyltransferase
VTGERVSIRPARPDEGERLRQIAIDAKSHWGYDEDWVRSWAAQGDFSPAALTSKPVLVVESGGCAIAFAMLIPKGDVAWLDDLWVEPSWIGRGVGTLLFEACITRAGELGAERMEWEAEPHAVGFYERMGGRYLRDSEPTAFGRVIPVMGVELRARAG